MDPTSHESRGPASGSSLQAGALGREQDRWVNAGLTAANSPPAPSATEGMRATSLAGLPIDDQPTVISRQPPHAEPARLGPLSTREVALALEGRQLDHFKLEKLIGGGGMGAVFRGVDLKLGRTVAIKILSRDQHDPETQRRFKNEAQSAARLDHENIARVYFVGEAEGWNYIVFEYVQGVNLRDLVEEKGPLPLAEAISYTVQVAEALRHAHLRDVVHRDIKPSNVLVAAQGKVKVVDMGLARLHQVESPENDLTASGVTLGTFDYISPEQARDPRSADVRSDLYSLGCTLYFMLSGRPPFPGGTVLQKLISHSSDPPPDVRQFRPDLPDELALVVERLLEKQPEKRYALPSDLIFDLTEACRVVGIELPVAAPVVKPVAPSESPAWERHLSWIVPAAALVVLAVGFDGFFRTPLVANRPPRFSVSAPRPGEIDPPQKGSGADPAKAPVVSKEPASLLPPASPREPANTAAKQPESPGMEDPLLPRAAIPAVVEKPVESAPPTSPAPSVPVSPELAGPTPPPAVAPPSVADMPSGPAAPPPMMKTIVEGMRPAAPPARTLVVGDSAKADGFVAFEDLDDAIAAIERGPRGAAAGEITIELRYNGPKVFSPIVLQDLHLALRPGTGFKPGIVFRPAAEGRNQAMISVFGGRLEMHDLSIELQLPRGGGEGGSLFAIQKPEVVRLVSCVLSIDGSQTTRTLSGIEPAFFELLPMPRLEGGPAADMMAMMEESPVPLDLYHTLARGPATFLRGTEAVPLRLYWKNGLLATSERFLAMGGSRKPARHGGQLELTLEHLTVAVAKGFILTSPTADARHPLIISARLNDNIFVSSPTAPLVEQRGYEPVETIRHRLEISGKGNFYQASFFKPMELFWRLVSLEPNPQTIDLDFEQWDKEWPEEKLPRRLAVMWLQPPAANIPWHRHGKDDYQLSPEPRNPARGSAGDGSDAGFDGKLLPDPPPADADPPAAESRDAFSAVPARASRVER